ncbi:MAG: hypothetical protein AAGL10_08775 [Pseudomonadota bacterium]
MIITRTTKSLLVFLAVSLLPYAAVTSAGIAQDQVYQTQDAAIPDRFHGTWDALESDCSGFSDARLTITAAEMVFYESVGKVTDVREDNEGALISVLASGEGETFETTYRLLLRGDNLLMEVAGTNYGMFERKRCPQ